MHQLFLGVTTRVTKEVQEWCTAAKKYSSLVRHIAVKNRQVMDLHLSWCKIQPHMGGKLGGWVSENFLGFVQLATIGILLKQF